MCSDGRETGVWHLRISAEYFEANVFALRRRRTETVAHPIGRKPDRFDTSTVTFVLKSLQRSRHVVNSERGKYHCRTTLGIIYKSVRLVCT